MTNIEHLKILWIIVEMHAKKLEEATNNLQEAISTSDIADSTMLETVRELSKEISGNFLISIS